MLHLKGSLEIDELYDISWPSEMSGKHRPHQTLDRSQRLRFQCIGGTLNVAIGLLSSRQWSGAYFSRGSF